MIVQLHYGEDGIDPTRSVHGDAVDGTTSSPRR